ncbi:hypothetical protein DICSQDRAFT_173329 [Dichomitus squalens LYAD-421 SS1]|uniref:Fungal-type protein kinase domain-containing protein n=1 Tax=Dichomitus squalens (strain LYAD-421) TaxID=732165 RepID=R7SQR6_DICSQ|nr:uncharacterized protein DICSQDRAFT_173329 [Dichomitus squalens LYAD-421 SS1]EJF58100.1 hypothetical protein DICSQDRAFT_173329 [Dichomitus squalens LYAD-421 SS1]
MSDINHPAVSAHSADHPPSAPSGYSAPVADDAAVAGAAIAANDSTTSGLTTDNPAAGTSNGPDQGSPDATTTESLQTAQQTLNPRPSFIRHCPSATNRHAYTKKTGKKLAPLLIDESGMGPRFHLLSNELFSSRIPGAPPTEAERSKFKSPRLWKGMLEKEIYPQLGKVIQSVLKAAGCKNLRFLDTANHKANDGNSGRKETFNDAGFYLNTRLARDATTFTAKHRKRSKMSEKELETRLLGLRSWHWMDVPIEVKGNEKESAFYFRSKPRGVWPQGEMEAADVMEKTEGEAEDGDRDGAEVIGDGTDAEDEEDEEDVEEDGEVEDDEQGSEIEDDEDGSEMGSDYGEDDGEEYSEVDDDEDADGADEEEANEQHGVDEGEEQEDSQAKSTDVPQPETVKRHVPPFIKLSDKGEKALGQFVEYMLNVFKHQHRTFCYAVYVCFDMARLLFFDRSGAYVSEPFSWRKPTSLLHEFVWKLAQLAKAGLRESMGRDTTANVVNKRTRRKFLREARRAELPSHVREGLKKAADGNCPLYKLEIEYTPPSPEEWFPDEPLPDKPRPSPSATPAPASSTSSGSPPPGKSKADSPVRKFIVGRPHFSADALVGRCTKGFMAFDVTNRKKWVPCFVKDSWRPYVPGRTRPEHLVYERLQRKGVTPEDGIATLICGGDVGGSKAQYTRVQDDLPDENRPVRRLHYRVAIAEIGLSVSEFVTFGELSGIFADALRAHRIAWDRAGVLHRDISVGNIMIRVGLDGKRAGFLIDWDLSRLQCELGLGAVEPDRTGTWQFRSAMSLLYPRKPYRRSDDIESFIYAYTYLVLRYHPINVRDLREKIETLFEGCSMIGGVKVGGDAKRALLRSGQLDFVIEDSPDLQELLNTILAHCKTSYDSIDYIEMDRLYGPIDVVAQTQASTQRRALTKVAQRPGRHGFGIRSEFERLPTLGAGNRPHSPAQPQSATELFDMGPFLSNSNYLMTLLYEHAEETIDIDNKAPDQFTTRSHQDVLRMPDGPSTRNIGTLSTNGTGPSGHVSHDNRSASSHDGFGIFWGPDLTKASSSSSSSKKRPLAEDPKDVVADGDGSLAVRRSKRIKAIKGKAPRGQSRMAKRG